MSMQLNNMEELITAHFLNKLYFKTKYLINSWRKYHILTQISVPFLQKHIHISTDIYRYIYIQQEEKNQFYNTQRAYKYTLHAMTHLIHLI